MTKPKDIQKMLAEYYDQLENERSEEDDDNHDKLMSEAEYLAKEDWGDDIDDRDSSDWDDDVYIESVDEEDAR